MIATGLKSVTLSICMMVKDEEHNLKRCLSSLNGVGDELIVVDTGSSDSTVAIAESFGAKVFFHPWEDDFSKHRNQTMEHASGDWVFIIDADEELFFESASSASHLKQWLAEIPSDCMSAAIIVKDIQQDQKVMQFNSVRLFRRGSVRYEGVVHNTPIILNGKAEAVIFPYIHIKHYGYDLSPEMQAKKRARTEGLLLKRIQQNPDDVAAYFYLTQAYTAYNEIGKAAECIEKYKEVSDRTGIKFNGSIYTTAFHVYKMLGDKQNAYEWLVAGLKDHPKDLDLLMSLTEFGVWTANIEFISKGARGFLRVYDEYQRNPVASGNRFTYANTPESYAYCLFHLSMITFQEACVLLEKLKNVLNVTREPFKIGVREDVQSIFTQFGLTKDDWASEKKIVTL